MSTTKTSLESQSESSYRYFVAAMLAAVYTFNFLDRQILSILQEPIKHDLNLSDTSLGLLTGLSFALFYTAFGIPVAWLADRKSRVKIIAAACGIWSLFSAACGLATNFAQLALARMGVGIGEAGGSPPSYSLISDYFHARQRGTGLAIYSLGVPVGSAVGSALGAWLAATYGWRVAFFSVGIPGLVLALIVLVVIREPKRGGLDSTIGSVQMHAPSPPLRDSIVLFFKDPVLLLTAVSSAMSAFVGYAMLNWGPSFLIRVKHMTLTDISLYYSLVLGISMAIGTFGSGWLVDKLGHMNKRAYALVPAGAFALSIPFFLGFLWAPSWQLALAFLAVPSFLNNMYLAPAITVIQNAVPPARRTVSSALLLFVLNLVGLGAGPLYVGRISDYFVPEYGTQSLQIALFALLPMILVTIAAHYAASLAIKRRSELAT